MTRAINTAGTAPGARDAGGDGKSGLSRSALLIGSSHVVLGRAVARELGIPILRCESGRFPDGEAAVSLTESVCGLDIFILEPTGPPVDAHLVEIVALIDACRRAGARRVIPIVPYFGYSRSDKRHRGNEPIMASAAARILEGVGADRLITVDLHSAQGEGFFHIPISNLSAMPVLVEALRSRLPVDTVVISPDTGRIKTAAAFASALGFTSGSVYKERRGGAKTRSGAVVGEVRGRPCLLIDDMITTGGTLAGAITALLDAGALPQITIAATHGLLLPGALEKLRQPAVREIFVTDTLPVTPDLPGVKVVSIAALLAEAIRQVGR